MSSEETEEPYMKEPRSRGVGAVFGLIGAAAFVGFLIWDWYLMFTSGTRALEPVFDLIFVKHRAIALPLTALGLMVALFVDTVRAKRDPKLGMTRFWRVVCLIVLAIALLVGVSDYWVR